MIELCQMARTMWTQSFVESSLTVGKHGTGSTKYASDWTASNTYLCYLTCY